MHRRHPSIPRLWLMTDPRIGERLWGALERLPRGSGVVFRHYALPDPERKALFARVSAVAKRRRLVLIRAGAWAGRGEAGVHGQPGRGLRSASAHNRREAIAAVRDGAQLLFVSPVYPTRSHPGGRALGRLRFLAMVKDVGVPVIALGGMNHRRARGLKIHGWAGIDAWA